jgi:hypothetical protein
MLAVFLLLPTVAWPTAACGGAPQSTVKSTLPVTATGTAAPTMTVPTQTGSADPVYDKYTAALTAAGIAFSPGINTDYATDKNICDRLRTKYDDAYQLKYYWMAEKKDDAARRIPAMIPILCPDQQTVLGGR